MAEVQYLIDKTSDETFFIAKPRIFQVRDQLGFR